MLENLFQDHNISAVLRTCDGLGVQDVHVIEKENVFRVNEEVALGAGKWLTIHRYNDQDLAGRALERCISDLRSRGYRIAATRVDPQALPVWEAPVDRPLALLLGTEMSGLSYEASDLADLALYYPMKGFADSFNVSVSAALFLQAVLKKMEQQGFLAYINSSDQEALVAEWLRHSIRNAEALLR